MIFKNMLLYGLQFKGWEREQVVFGIKNIVVNAPEMKKCAERYIRTDSKFEKILVQDILRTKFYILFLNSFVWSLMCFLIK